MQEISESPKKTIFTIGHSNHSFDHFQSLLKQHQIEVVADVRSRPYSEFAPEFNREFLQKELKRVGFQYVFLGRELGGRPNESNYYDAEGHVLYCRLCLAPFFSEGIDRIQKGMEKYRVAMMCSEEDPSVCHRHLLIGRVLLTQGCSLIHIRGDGELESTLPAEEPSGNRLGFVTTLFGEEEDLSWRSLRSVLPKNRPLNSSES